MTQVLDLRKKNKKNAPKFTRDHSSRPLIQSKSASPHISWEAPSFYFNPQRKYLALVMVALATSGGAMLFLQKDTLTAIFLILSSLVLILYSNKRPDISKITLNQAGVEIGDMMYYYKDLKSFWINYEPGSFKELSLEPRRWYLPYFKVSIENQNPLIIRSLLVNFLPEREHEHSLVDIISRRIGL